MEESILFPSPNWFQVSGLVVSCDGWLIYGGPSRSLCILKPLPVEGTVQSKRSYRAHVVNWAHPEKITNIDISPSWPEKKTFLTASVDGSVKQWYIEEVEDIVKTHVVHNHEIHSHQKEEVAGVGFTNESCAITAGCFGHLVKWELSSNVVKTYNNLLKTFRPTCMRCSPHLPFHLAVGTKQGVVFFIDLSSQGKIVYKVTGQDDEIVNVGWCPQYEVGVKKALSEPEKKSNLTKRLETIRQVEESESLNVSASAKDLPDDSFDETIVIIPEDEMFDVYKDHEADEFGHKKFVPEEILVKVKDESEDKEDFLAECCKLKNKILHKKIGDANLSIDSLADTLKDTHVDDKENLNENCNNSLQESKSIEFSDHIHRHLLATVGKNGGIRIWSKSGKLVSSSTIYTGINKNVKHRSPIWSTLLWYKSDTLLVSDSKYNLLEINPLKIDCYICLSSMNKASHIAGKTKSVATTRPETYLNRNKNRLEYRPLHSEHRRVICCIASDIPRIQVPSAEYNGNIWTVSQDRNLICYSMKDKVVSTYSTCGGFVYNVQTCPYDARRVAVSVGDGTVHIWETDTLPDDDSKLSAGHVTTYWQNVHGKVLTVAWHPTKEYLLAFGTAESRVGLIDTSGTTERPAKVLLPKLSSGVYSLCWGDEFNLYAVGGGELVVYQANKPDKAPTSVNLSVDDKRWEVCACSWRGGVEGAGGFAVGSLGGGVAVLTTTMPHSVLAAVYVFSKMIHTIVWHPEQTSLSSEESQYKNYLAVCSLDKQNTIAILEYSENEDGSKKLLVCKSLSGHKAVIHQLAWNPHKEMQLLSTSQDTTVRVWDAVSGACLYIFGGHGCPTLSAAWNARPSLATRVASGGADCVLRSWDCTRYPADTFDETKTGAIKKEKKKRYKKAESKELKPAYVEKPFVVETEESSATKLETKVRCSKKFLMPISHKQIISADLNAAKKMYEIYLKKIGKHQTVPEENGKEADNEETVNNLDHLKMFGSINEVNELLDMEMEHLEADNKYSSCVTSLLLRGRVHDAVTFAAQKEFICPYLLSLTPTVSFKYWKDSVQLYLAQIDSLVAKKQEDQLFESTHYGGLVYRKVMMFLSIHDITSALKVLLDAHLYKEAYVLCRVRHMNSKAEEVLREWANQSALQGCLVEATVCYIAYGDLTEAAKILGKSNDQQFLSLAADIAKTDGQITYAGHLENKKQLLESVPKKDDTEEILEKLPSRIELLLKNGDENCDSSCVLEE